MARAVAALVLCLAVLVAAAHAGRVIEYQALEAGFDAAAPLAPLAAESSPSPSAADDVAADAGGVRTLGLLNGGRASVIGDVVWWVLQWANQAAGGDKRKAY